MKTRLRDSQALRYIGRHGTTAQIDKQAKCRLLRGRAWCSEVLWNGSQYGALRV